VFDSTGLVDIAPSSISPTWRNGRPGSKGISKRLDRFLMNETLMGGMIRCRSWVINSFLTDHNLVCLQFDENKETNHYPFKFNHAWLLEPDFILMVRKTWNAMVSWQDTSAMNFLVVKLKKLKEVVVLWKKEKRKMLQTRTQGSRTKIG
jgi:hypothetical protein